MKPECVPITEKHLGEYFVDPVTQIKFRLMTYKIIQETTRSLGAVPRVIAEEKHMFFPIDATDEEIWDEYEDEYEYEELGRLVVWIEDASSFVMVDKDFQFEIGLFCSGCGKACNITHDLESSCCGEGVCNNSLLTEEVDPLTLNEFIDVDTLNWHSR